MLPLIVLLAFTTLLKQSVAYVVHGYHDVSSWHGPTGSFLFFLQCIEYMVRFDTAKLSSMLLVADTALREANFGEAFDMAGKMIALLPNGIVLPHCMSNVMELIYEMEYMTMVRPALPETRIHIETHLRQLQASRMAGEPGKWWRSPDVIHRSSFQ